MNGLEFCAVTAPACIQSTYRDQHKGMWVGQQKKVGVVVAQNYTPFHGLVSS